MNASGNAVQVTNYYPSGASLAESPAQSDQGTQPYKYNGKELDREGGWDAYDYGARMYDPAMGRFMTMDPLAEKYYSVSPYAYCLNNPIKNVDPDGRFVGTIIGTKEHVNNARPSTKGPHEEGRARNKRDRGGEKGDARRNRYK